MRSAGARVAMIGLALAAAAAALLQQGRERFLWDRDGSPWMTVAPRGTLYSRAAIEIPAVFTSRLQRPRPTSEPTFLEVRAFRRALIRVNGRSVLKEPIPSARIDVGNLLHPGDNDVEIIVVNDFGPPAVAVALDGTASNDWSPWQVSWGGGTQEPVFLASSPFPRIAEADRDVPSPIQAFRDRAGILAVLFAMSLAALALGTRLNIPSRFAPPLVFLVIATIWIALAFHNRRHLDSAHGYDASHHYDYIAFLQRYQRLPRAEEGFEMFQPPFYYRVCAFILNMANQPAGSDNATATLRLVGLGFGLVMLASVFLSLREVFPQAPGAQVAGLLFAGTLPANLFLYQFVSNEGPVASLTALATWLVLRLIKAERPSIELSLATGVVAGLALLTKLTAAVGLVAMGAAMVDATFRGPKTPNRLWRLVVWPLAIALAVGGWHYVRLAARHGDPFLGNWDPRSGYAWWQCPGYRTWSQFTRFGDGLFTRSFGRTDRVVESLWMTLWGDGGLGGSGMEWHRPPWTMEAREAGYWLAFIPATLLVVGFLGRLKKWIATPTPTDVLLLGHFSLMVLAILRMNLVVPYFSLSKGFFLVSTIVPMSAFVGQAIAGARRLNRWASAMAMALLMMFGVNALDAFWIDADATATLRSRATGLFSRRQYEACVPIFEEISRREPGDVRAKCLLSLAKKSLGDKKTSERLLAEIVDQDPHFADALLDVAAARIVANRLDDAAVLLDRALDDNPDLTKGRLLRASLREERKDVMGAEADLRRALAVNPTDLTAINAMVGLLMRANRPKEAAPFADRALAIAEVARLTQAIPPARAQRDAVRAAASAAP